MTATRLSAKSMAAELHLRSWGAFALHRIIMCVTVARFHWLGGKKDTVRWNLLIGWHTLIADKVSFAKCGSQRGSALSHRLS